ncbi:hypothetical protein [Amycolatopsis sp. NPDC021455]
MTTTKPKRHKTFRRLARTAAFSLIRGAATAAGSALVAAAVWWLEHH